jgi:hypothetical protein
MRRAFLVRLNAGKSDIDTRSNLGLAIRLRPVRRSTTSTRWCR